MPKPPPTILCVAPCNNPHIVPIFDALAARDDVDVLRASLFPLSADRQRMGWPEMAADAPYLQPWRRAADRWRYWRGLARADFVILPGFFQFPTLPLHHAVRRLLRKPTLMWSEPFAGHPRTLAQSPLRRRLKRWLIQPFNSPDHCLLVTGEGAEDDYRQLGMHRWQYREFALAVAPSTLPRNSEAAEPAPQNGLRIVFCGALNHRKGVDLLIEAVRRPELRKADFHLTLIGDGPLRDELSRKCSDDAALTSKVSFLGSRPAKECRAELSKHDVLVLPSRYDGWGAIVNEAMEAGLAIVVSDHVGSRGHLVRQNENGLVFQSDSVESLRYTLQTLIGDRPIVESMKARSLERIKQYRPANIASSLAALMLAIRDRRCYSNNGELLRPL